MSENDATRPLSGEDAPDAEPSSLKGLTMALGIEPAEPGHDPLLGRDIGGVTIVRLIAEGGMGRVYEGLQDHPRRSVAVKLMRPGFVSDEGSRRFSLEMEILARLQHPFIAQIYTAGMCDVVGTKVPFFVMEFIPDALPITRYAAAKSLTVKERLALFRKACEAVAHGHHSGVIHRDLKPGNILVDRAGTPKVIDFGVARCMDAKPEQMTALTNMGQLIGTIQYMSPEQISADPDKVDGRSDVYALGVILYELLTGRRPYEVSQRQIFDAMRVVHETRPMAPSHLNREVEPDVEAIAGGCLHKNHAKRFADAAEIVTALDRHLGGGRARRADAAGAAVVEEVFTAGPGRARRWRWFFASAAAAAMAATGALLAVQWPGPGLTPGETAWEFRRSRELDDFAIEGTAALAPAGGVRLGDGGGPSAILTREAFTAPLRVEYDVVAGPTRVLDIFPGLFVDEADGRSGIQYRFGDNANSRSFVLVHGRYVEIPHRPIEAGRPYRIVLEVDADRRLAVTRDGETVYEEILPADVDLRGSVKCGGGFGDVTYRRLCIRQPPRPATPVPDATPLEIGAAIDVLDQGIWWPGRVLAGGRDGRVVVSYTTWGTHQDATVPRSRVRRAPPACPQETIAFRGHDYWFPARKTDRSTAQLEAGKAGGTLVVIDDTAENEFVARHVHGTTWLGIGKSKAGWVTLADGDPVAFFSWDQEERQPTSTSGEIAAATNPRGFWHDHRATDELYFVVERPTATADGEDPAADEGARRDAGDSVVGRWRWFVDGSEVQGHEFLPNGAIAGSPESSWLLVDPDERRYQFLWAGRAFMDVMTLSRDGTTLRGRNNLGRTIEGRRD